MWVTCYPSKLLLRNSRIGKICFKCWYRFDSSHAKVCHCVVMVMRVIHTFTNFYFSVRGLPSHPSISTKATAEIYSPWGTKRVTLHQVSTCLTWYCSADQECQILYSYDWWDQRLFKQGRSSAGIQVGECCTWRVHRLESISSAALKKIIEDTILHMNIKLENCRGKCYDGSSAMTGKKMVLLWLLPAESREPSSLTVMDTLYIWELVIQSSSASLWSLP